MMKQIFCVLLVAVLFVQFGQSAEKQDYYNLYDTLFGTANYRKEVRPAENENSTVFVYMVFNLLSLDGVDEKQQTMVSSARLDLSWDDDYLSWNATAYGNINTLLVPQEKIYLPDIVVGNSVKAQGQLGYDELQVRLYDSGIIDWEPTVLLSTSCDIDITYFPFDTQKCYVEFETSVSKKSEIDVNIHASESPISLEDYSPNGQWEVVDTKAENLGDEDSKTKIRFGFLLKRRRTFYLLNIILPIFFLSLCASMVFALPAEEGEKMGTGITVLLAFAVYLTILSELVPNTSLQVSILALYLTMLIGLSAISIVVCVLILRLHFRDADKPVGSKTCAIFHFLRRCMFLDRKGDRGKNQVGPDLSKETEMKEKKDETVNARSPSIELSLGPNSQDITWQDVAFTLDFFCFIFFSLLTIVFTLICLLVIHGGGQTNAPSL